MSVYENIAFGLKMRKYDKNIIDEKVKSVAEALNLSDLLERKPKQLSGGQRQRVALGRAIVRDPKVFLMDEPLSNLDANLRVQMRAEIKRLHKKLGTTFIYVTHDQTEALTMGDRIAVLDKGKLQQIDTPERIYNNPKNLFVAGFIGQMNFIPVRIDKNVFNINGVEFSLPTGIKKEALTIGIRAEKMIYGDTSVKVPVDINELNGSEKLVYFELNGAKCSAKVPTSYNFDSDIILNLKIDDMYFFDSVTGENILYS